MHPGLMEKSGWTYNKRFRDVDAAQRWGCPTPGDFHDMDKDDKLDVLAWYEARWRIDAVNAHEASRKASQKSKR